MKFLCRVYGPVAVTRIERCPLVCSRHSGKYGRSQTRPSTAKLFCFKPVWARLNPADEALWQGRNRWPFHCPFHYKEILTRSEVEDAMSVCLSVCNNIHIQ